MNAAAPAVGGVSAARQARLHWRLVAVLLLVSLLPLGLVGLGAWRVFGRQLAARSLELQRATVSNHAATLDLYLRERLHALELLARTHGVKDLSDPARLRRLYAQVSATYGEAFVDLGVIGAQGDHLAYVGPYDLEDRNYAAAPWFRDTMVQGSHVSDVFLGYRQVPHCVMAVKRQEGDQAWILRATINSDRFAQLVRTGQLGATGDAFLINREGVYQTPPRLGQVLEPSSLGAPAPHRGVREERVRVNGAVMLRVTTWIGSAPWLLVVQQDEAEIQAPVRQALTWGLLLLGLAVALIVVTTVLATGYLTNQIDRANAERERLAGDLLRSAKLASLGEMSTGLAHEINNPLAIISAEQTNLSDLLRELPPAAPARGEMLEAVARCQRQITRCSGITAKMLQFGRAGEARSELTPIGPRLQEIVQLLHKQAEVRNVALELDVAPDLPRLLLDPTELQQVLVNLINNSLYALDGGGRILISAKRAGDQVQVAVKDNGTGIAPADLERIFQPFFTTKPVGQGTGMGLAVCYGIVQRWGGTITAASELGSGTVMTLHLPAPRDERTGRA